MVKLEMGVILVFFEIYKDFIVRNLIIYLFPMSFDIVVALTMFVGRHSFAERDAGVATIGSFAAIYGLVYIPSSFLMGKIVTPERSKRLMLTAIVLMIVLLCLLANIENFVLFIAIFAGVPFGTSLFFNSFQAYMLDIDSSARKALSHTVGHYTFAWSTGFAMGPVVSYFANEYFTWSAAYYMAAIIVFIIGIIAFLFKPSSVTKQEEDNGVEEKTYPTDKALPISGWLGLVIGLSTFQIILTYWPMQAKNMDFSVLIKGGVEFSASMAQALTALAICVFIRWYHRPFSLLCFGASGFIGLALFGIAENAVTFFIGAIFFGIYSSSCFLYMVYHSMFDKEKAVKRVSMNEVIVGVAILSGPIIATSLLIITKSDFKTAYQTALAIFAVGICIQTFVARKEHARVVK